MNIRENIMTTVAPKKGIYSRDYNTGKSALEYLRVLEDWLTVQVPDEVIALELALCV